MLISGKNVADESLDESFCGRFHSNGLIIGINYDIFLSAFHAIYCFYDFFESLFYFNFSIFPLGTISITTNVKYILDYSFEDKDFQKLKEKNFRENQKKINKIEKLTTLKII